MFGPLKTRYIQTLFLCAVCVAIIVFSVGRIVHVEPSDHTPIFSDDPAHAALSRGVLPSMEKLRLHDSQGQWEVRIGRLDIRRRNLGFLRLGAFNTAHLHDLRITVSEDTGVEELHRLLQRMTSFSDLAHHPRRRIEGMNTTSTSNSSGWLAGFPEMPSSVSDLRISRFSIDRRTPDRTGAPVVRADTLIPQRSTGTPVLLLKGNVTLVNKLGHRIACPEAKLRLDDDPILSIREGTLHAASSTQELTAVSFPLAVLFQDQELDITPPAAIRRRAY